MIVQLDQVVSLALTKLRNIMEREWRSATAMLSLTENVL